MSQAEPTGPYVYQPHPVSRKDGRLWHVGGMPDGMTREQAQAIVDVLKAHPARGKSEDVREVIGSATEPSSLRLSAPVEAEPPQLETS